MSNDQWDARQLFSLSTVRAKTRCQGRRAKKSRAKHVFSMYNSNSHHVPGNSSLPAMLHLPQMLVSENRGGTTRWQSFEENTQATRTALTTMNSRQIWRNSFLNRMTNYWHKITLVQVDASCPLIASRRH